jgi:hypothetical protein
MTRRWPRPLVGWGTRMTKQLAQTFSESGVLLGQQEIETEREYCELMRSNVEEYGNGCYTVCSDVEEAKP